MMAFKPRLCAPFSLLYTVCHKGACIVNEGRSCTSVCMLSLPCVQVWEWKKSTLRDVVEACSSNYPENCVGIAWFNGACHPRPLAVHTHASIFMRPLGTTGHAALYMHTCTILSASLFVGQREATHGFGCLVAATPAQRSGTA